MLPYQLSMTLADMRIRQLVAEAERHALLAAARRDSTDTPTLTTRLRHLATQTLATFQARGAASVGETGTSARADLSTRTSGSSAGPIGCSA
jgi:hypothetical protein